MNKSVQAKSQSIFVICDPGSDISLLISVLHNLGLHILNTEDAFATANSDLIVTNTLDLIKRADLVCAVVQEQIGPNVLLELGYALGAGLPAVIIGDTARLPSELATEFTIQTPITDTAALNFQLEAFLNNLRNRKRGRPDRVASPQSQPLKSPSKLVSRSAPQSGAERELLEALQGSAEIKSIAAQPSQKSVGFDHIDERFVPDFAVWFADAPDTIGAQAIIELKGLMGQWVSIEDSINQLKTYAQHFDIQTGIMLMSGEHAQRYERHVVSLSPLIFVYTLAEFYELLKLGRLIETLRRERNRFAHSAG